MSKTIWLPVAGFESRYLASSGGKIKSIHYGKIVRPVTTEKGYKRVFLWNGKKRVWVRVHVIIATLFCENDDPENKKEVNHIFGKKWDNRSSQLEWTTRRENLDHAKENGFTRGKNKRIKTAKIIQKQGEFLKLSNSI